DEREECILSQSIPKEFLSYNPGQWFEAKVKRKGSCIGKTLGIENVVARKPLEPISGEEFARKMAHCRIVLPIIPIEKI
ncbi:MAG: hypothetical protein AABY32_05430, partial [Nanoarchaeota archaeon]